MQYPYPTHNKIDTHTLPPQCRNSGWVGIGFKADPNTMKNADIHMCRRYVTYSSFRAHHREGIANMQCIRAGNDSYIITDMFALDVGPPKTYASCRFCCSTVIYDASRLTHVRWYLQGCRTGWKARLV